MNSKITSSSVMMILSVLILIFTGCSKHEESSTGEKLSVAHPWRQDLSITKKYVAQINAIQHIELRAFERGYLQNIFIDEGQDIKKDQEMFEIMPFIMKAEYEKSKAEYDLARIEYNNTKGLQQKKVVSKNELALARAKLNKAKAELSLSKTHLDFTKIKAPFDGMMDRFRVRLGSLVDEGELLSTLSDISQVWVYFNVSEVDYLEYMKKTRGEEKKQVRLELANGEIFDQVGVIDTIEADFNNETGNVAFRATFSNPNKLLRHGETGNIIIEEVVKNALIIPQKSTFEILDKRYVYVLDEKNKIVSRQITISEDVPHLFAVTSGLKETDRFLLDGLGKVKVGQEIKPEVLESSAVLAGLKLPLN